MFARNNRLLASVIGPMASGKPITPFLAVAFIVLAGLAPFVSRSIAAAGADSRPASVPSEVWAFDDGLHGEPGGVAIQGSPSANKIIVAADPVTPEYVVSDGAGAVTTAEPGPGRRPCDVLDPFTLRCPRLGPSLSADLGPGNDKLEVRGRVQVGAVGGPGADAISGSSRDDYLRGGSRGDVLKGRSGDDELIANRGPDSARGGVGDDRLVLADADRDERIGCGRGDDVALVDRGLDPAPHGCERVRTFR
jgi:hypothetical protein